MRKIIAVFYLYLILSILPIPLYGQTGVYNSWSGLFWCEPISCTHEVGHKLNDMSGWVSKNDEFINIIADIGWTQGKNPNEKYASIFAFAKGKKENMPVVLQPFYDWELAELLMSGIWPTLPL